MDIGYKKRFKDSVFEPLVEKEYNVTVGQTNVKTSSTLNSNVAHLTW